MAIKSNIGKLYRGRDTIKVQSVHDKHVSTCWSTSNSVLDFTILKKYLIIHNVYNGVEICRNVDIYFY